MRNKGISFRVLLCGGVAVLALLAQSPQPTCHHCQATYIPVSELDAYTAVLARLRAAIDAADGAALEAVFARSRIARTEWQEQRTNASALGDASK